jgi:MFS family permease
MKHDSKNNLDNVLSDEVHKLITEDDMTNKPNLLLYDKLIEEKGYTKQHYKSIIMTLLLLSTEGVQIPLTSILFIPLKSFFNMTDVQAEIGSAILFLGVGIGSALVSLLSAVLGRTQILYYSLVTISMFQLITIFMHDYWIFVFLRFMIGISLGTILPIALNSLLEILPIKNRSIVMTLVWSGVGCGVGLLYVSIFILMPNYELSGLKYVYTLMFFYSLFLLVLIAYNFNDSPRNLIIYRLNLKKSEGELIKETKRALNTSYNYKLAFEVLGEIMERKITEKEKLKVSEELVLSSKILSHESSGLEFLFNSRNWLTSTCLTLIWLFICVSLYGPVFISSVAFKTFGITDSNNTILKLQLVSSVALFFSIILGGFLSEVKFLGRRITMLISWAFSFIASIFVWIFPISLPYISVVLALAFGIGNNVSVTYSSECYYTKERDFAIGFLFMVGRIGGIVSQFLFLWAFNIHPLIPFYILSAMYGTMCVLTLLLPYETFGKSIDHDYKNDNLYDRITKGKSD